MREAARRRAVALVAAALFGPACAKVFRDPPRATVPPAVAQQQLAELWVDPGDVGRLDLYHGPGGRELLPAPGASFDFVAKDTKGWSAGWDVRDATGRQWSVKLGPESQSEVVASRILWAMGYRQPPTYYVADWTLKGGPEPGKGAPGRFRPDLAGGSRTGSWNWEKNPFAETQPFRGLMVLMRLINNWDLLDRNTTIYEFDAPRDGARRWFVVIDLGAAFGRTNATGLKNATRNDIDDYERQGFIEKVEPDGRVEFDQLGRYHRGLFGRLTTTDVRWTCQRLARISDGQWRDVFRAAGYDQATAERFIKAIRQRIAAGLALRAGA